MEEETVQCKEGALPGQLPTIVGKHPSVAPTACEGPNQVGTARRQVRWALWQASLRAALDLSLPSWRPHRRGLEGPIVAEQTLEKEAPDSTWAWGLPHNPLRITGCKRDLSPLCVGEEAPLLLATGALMFRIIILLKLGKSSGRFYVPPSHSLYYLCVELVNVTD